MSIPVKNTISSDLSIQANEKFIFLGPDKDD